MNIETRLEPRLWEAVRASIEVRNFSAAVLDSIHYLSDVIRERSGLEGDGVSLVGSAFGGSSPKLKVNRLQTESEQNEQRGVEALLRGMYQAVRNPRSHGTHQDDERSAVAIILFVDHLLRIVDRSRTPFTMATFTAKVFDPAFVPKKEYAELLAKEVPDNRRLAVLRELFARRSEGKVTNTGAFMRVMLDEMKPEEADEFYSFISEELATTDDDDTLRLVLTTVNANNWIKIGEAARMRVEHKLIQSVKTGKYQRTTERCITGGLGTWAARVARRFTLADDLWRAVSALLQGSEQERDYALTYLMPEITHCFSAPPHYIVAAVKAGLKSGDQRFSDLVDIWAVTTELDEDGEFTPKPFDHPWRKPFLDARDHFVPAEPSDDDIPF